MKLLSSVVLMALLQNTFTLSPPPPSRTYPLFLKDDWDHPDQIFVPLSVKCPLPLKPFAVSIPRVGSHWETCATDRTNALLTLSPTVWTKEEWDDAAKLEEKYPITKP